MVVGAIKRYDYLFIFFFFCLIFVSPISSATTNNGYPALIEKDMEIMQALSKNLPVSSPTINYWNTTGPNPCLWGLDRIACSSYKSFSRVAALYLGDLGLHTSTSNNSNFFFELLCRLDSLKSLDLSFNSFTTIPTSFYSNCTGLYGSLKRLSFEKNRLTGPIGNFSSFRMLEVLDLSYNTLEGQVSPQLAGLTNLRILILFNNYLNGTIPLNASLEALYLRGNWFEGQIPVEISQLRNFTLLDISNNRLSGTIPNGIDRIEKLESLDISGNYLTGEIPNNLFHIKQLRIFLAKENNLHGTIPANMTRYLSYLDLSNNRLTGEIPSDLLSPLNLRYAYLSSNFLQGQIPQNLSQNLLSLILRNNSLHGSIPQGIGQLSNLAELELDDNELDGPIPHQLGRCNNLNLLNLSGNRLQGELPVELGNLISLHNLALHGNYFRGNIPTKISNLVNLTELDLGNNLLTGMIPSAIFNLTNLSILNFEHNKLSGSIPKAIINLKYLTSLQLGNNKLSGIIPKLQGSLSSVLDLSSNFFSGPIPSHLGFLNYLEILDLSNNKFTGDVPTFLTKMENLKQLNLSNNQLSGTLPQFPAWINVTVTGNNLTRDDEMTGKEDIKQSKASLGKRDVFIMISAFVGGFITSISMATIVQVISSGSYQTGNESSPTTRCSSWSDTLENFENRMRIRQEIYAANFRLKNRARTSTVM